MDGGFVAHGEFVESGCYGAVAFEAVDAAFHRMTTLVDFGVEAGRPATLGSLGLSVGILVGLAGDGGLDPTPAQVAAVRPRRVRLVGQDPIRSGPGSATTEAGYPDSLEHHRELRAVATLPSGKHDRQWFLPLLAAQVQLGGQPTPGPTQRMIGRLVTDSTGRFGLQIPLLRAPAAC